MTGFEKRQFLHTINNRNTNSNYLNYCISGRKTDACMQFTTML